MNAKQPVNATDGDKELYRFYWLYERDLEHAKRMCELLGRRYSGELRESIVRDIVTAYSRPFSGNKGRIVKRHRLDEDVVPPPMKSLHDELIDVRNRAFAHTDQDFFQPHLLSFPATDGGDVHAIMLTVPQYRKLFARRQQIMHLIAAVVGQVRHRREDLERTYGDISLNA